MVFFQHILEGKRQFVARIIYTIHLLILVGLHKRPILLMNMIKNNLFLLARQDTGKSTLMR